LFWEHDLPKNKFLNSILVLALFFLYFFPNEKLYPKIEFDFGKNNQCYLRNRKIFGWVFINGGILASILGVVVQKLFS